MNKTIPDPASEEGVAVPAAADDAWLDEPITPIEAGSFLKVPYSTLSKWRLNNTGPAYLKLGGRLVRYRRRDLIDWLNSCVQSPSNETGEK
ncbi:helix-turn-helix transcriptional regulator [Emcibacter nanhaiensis]|uniref:Helix-turn-helix domain-containing protein n=1 Tax=Emcibacter nanhaiensis TaxID=1505037 RepID=A0A501PG85_9PROT|nr:helix-turn-helix domain-containing protein [Emcibacter nanhaiensis]TPD58991.1 helix-turn-helix domain-containing protein [Emcibacter nanhaiensis]